MLVLIFLALMVCLFQACRGNDLFDTVMFTILGLIIGSAVGLGGVGLAALYANHHPSSPRNDTYQLASLSSGTGASGSFFLATGSLNSEPMYYYYYKSDNGLRMSYTNADSTVVKQDATPDTSYITYYCQDYKASHFYTWPFPKLQWDDCFNFVNEIHIPPGSIQTGFDASLPN